MLDCAFVCGLKSTGKVCVFRVFAPVSLYLSLAIAADQTHNGGLQFLHTSIWPNVYPRLYSAA